MTASRPASQYSVALRSQSSKMSMRNTPPVYQSEPPAMSSVDLSTGSRTLQRDSGDTDVSSPYNEAPEGVQSLSKEFAADPLIDSPGVGGVEAADLEKGGGEPDMNRKSTMSGTGTMASTKTIAEKGEPNRNESEMLTGVQLWMLFGYVLE